MDLLLSPLPEKPLGGKQQRERDDQHHRRDCIDLGRDTAPDRREDIDGKRRPSAGNKKRDNKIIEAERKVE